MRKHFKKRLAAFKVGLVLSIMITPFCFVDKVYAQNGIFFNNSIMTWSQLSYLFTENFDTGDPCYLSICGSFDGVYDGTITLTYDAGGDPVLSMPSYKFYPVNCHIDSITNTTITLSFTGQNYVELIVQETAGFTIGGTGIQFLSAAGSMSKISDSVAEDLHQIGTDIYSALFNVRTDVAFMKVYFNRLLNNLFGDPDDQSDYGMAGDVYGIYYELQDVKYRIQVMSSTIDNIYAAVQNIDSQIDTISWQNFTTPSQIDYSYDDANFTTYTSGNINITSNKLIIRIPSQAFRYTRLYKLTLPFYYYNNANNGGFKLVNVYPSASTTDKIVSYYTTGSTEQMVIYFCVNSSVNASNIYINLEFDNKKGSLSARGSMSLQYIDQNDIEYWQLLNIMNQFDYNQKILEAIKSVTINIEGDIINQTENVINDYDFNFEIINDVESSFTNNFETINSNVRSTLTEKVVVPQDFENGSNFMKVLFTKFVDGDTSVRLPYYLLLAVVVLVVLLG